MTLTLLVDADINIYQACASAEEENFWPADDPENPDRGLWTLHSDPELCRAMVVQDFDKLMERFEADYLAVVLSDTNRGRIFRKDIYEPYKSNRKPTRKPLAYWPTVDFVKENYETYERPSLEGDDVLGILATSDKIIKGEKIVVSIDKDLKTVPCTYFKGEWEDDGTPIVHVVTEEEADHFHLLQSLAGDPTDGYPGCPGIGMGTADTILAEPRLMVQVERVLKSGPRKGESEWQWKKGDECTPWEAIVSQYAKAGLTEEDALTQARCARILRASDYNFKLKEPILWTP